MLYQFSVGNYLSFKEIQTLSLIPDALKEFPENFHNVYGFPNDKLLKSVAIYGHNSYGKSNLIKAYRFLINLIFNSFAIGQTQDKIDISQFKLNTSTIGKPSLFEIVFLIKNTKYRYRLQLTSESIIEEGLYYAEAGVRENSLFERIGQHIKVSKTWERNSNTNLSILTTFAKPHILYLSVLISQNNIHILDEIAEWLKSNIIISDDYQTKFLDAYNIYSDLDYRPLILRFIERADLGFTTILDKIKNRQPKERNLEKGFVNLVYEEEIKNFDLYTKHNVYDESHSFIKEIEFDLQKNESTGSIKYFIVVCLLSFAIKKSQILWIDELDARLHADLLKILLDSFHDPKMNPINAQMIFTTHNTTIMDGGLRRDQMVAITKNEWGESELERVHTSQKPIKTGKSVEREYRKGNLPGVSKKIKKDLGPTLFD